MIATGLFRFRSRRYATEKLRNKIPVISRLASSSIQGSTRMTAPNTSNLSFEKF